MRTEQTIINVIFDAGRGTLSEKSREAIVGMPLGTLPQPIRRGYRFAGWYEGDRAVTAETVVENDTDLHLSARWEKESAPQKNSSFKRQRIALIALSVTAVLLVVAWIITSQLIAIYTLYDTYVRDGVSYTDIYKIKREDGVYKLFDNEGNRMPTDGVNENVFIADRGSKNHYLIDPETGEYRLRAVVDTEGVEATQGTTLLLYPQISSQNLYTLKVTHKDGHSYKFINKTSGTVLEGFEDSLIHFEDKVYSMLCLAAGWTASDRKLTADDDVAKLSDGSIDYAVYGLDDPTTTFEIQAALFKKDEDGKTLYKDNNPVFDYAEGTDKDGNPTKEYQPDPDQKYTVHIGDATPSGGGYYVQLEGNSAIYILSSTYVSQTLLKPIEALVTPKAVHTVSLNMYNRVNNFYLTHLDEWSKEGADQGNVIVGFSFEIMDRRENTMNSTHSFRNIGNELMEGYEINSASVNTALSDLYKMQYISCVKLGLSQEVLEEYGLDKDIYYLSYGVDLDEKDGKDIFNENQIIIGQKNENGNYYVASITYDMVVEVAPTYLAFVEWEEVKWYEKSIFGVTLGFVEEMIFQFGNKTYNFDLDNSLSYSFYFTSTEDNNGNRVPVLAPIDASIGYLYYEGKELKYKVNNGVVYDAINIDLRSIPVITQREAVLDPDRKNVIYTEVIYYYINEDKENIQVDPNYTTRDIECRDGNFWYVEYDDSGNVTFEKQVIRDYGDAMYRYSKGMQAIISVGTDFLKVTVSEEGGKSTVLDYTITETYRDDTGVEKVETVTALNNFRTFFLKLLYFSLEGDVNEKDFISAHGKDIASFLANKPTPDAVITLQARDFASILNAFTSYDFEDKEEYRLHTEDLTKNLVVRFYKYSDWKALVTVQTFEVDENGNKIYSDTAETGKFFINYKHLTDFEVAINQLINREIVSAK